MLPTLYFFFKFDFQNCIFILAAPVLSAFRKRKKRARMERNAHLFAVDLVPGEDDIDDTDESEDDSEPEEFDSKKVKLELEEYGDID